MLQCCDKGVATSTATTTAYVSRAVRGVYAHKSIENGIVENVLVEDCTFGPALHGILTMGSECIHAKKHHSAQLQVADRLHYTAF